MKHPITVTVAALVGAFGIYCTQSVVTNSDKDGGLDALTDGPVGEASADPAPGAACCALAAPKFKSLGALTVTNSTPSAVLAVGAYREIVIYRVSVTVGDSQIGGSCSYGPASSLVQAVFRADASSPFGSVAAAESGRLTVQGSDLQMRWQGPQGLCTGTVTYQIAGVE